MDTQAARAEQIIQVGEAMAREGVEACNVELLLLAHDARDAGVEPILVDIMIDEGIPEVVRERAFALVGSRLVRLAPMRPTAITDAERSSHALAAR